jgi:hypothetical protein
MMLPRLAEATTVSKLSLPRDEEAFEAEGLGIRFA